MVIPILASCSSDYVNVIPSDSIALLSIDMAEMAKTGRQDGGMLKTLLQVNDINDCGIDLTEKIYAFEAPDGSLGLVCKVADSDDLGNWIKKLSKKQICTPLKERKGCQFTVLNGNFIIGFSDDAMLIMGPSIGSAQAELQRQMTNLLKADDNATRETRMFEKLESLNGPITLVAQAQALPQKFTAPLTLGASKGASPADILIAASITFGDNGVLSITGENFSFDKSIDNSLKEAASQYLPVTGKYLSSINGHALLTMVCGVNGEEYIKQLRNNDAFRTLLLGLNTAIDIDMMLKSVKGDMVVTINGAKADHMDFQIVADVSNKSWLKDVDYWKQSCPEGSTITNWKKKDSFHFSSKDWNAFFGLNDNQLFFGSTEDLAEKAGKTSTTPLPNNLQNMIKNKRLCLVLGVEAMADIKPELKTATRLLRPVLGDIKTIVYSIK